MVFQNSIKNFETAMTRLNTKQATLMGYSKSVLLNTRMSTVVEHSTYNLQIEGSNPATDTSGENMALFILNRGKMFKNQHK
jgi:hypothetical protein